MEDRQGPVVVCAKGECGKNYRDAKTKEDKTAGERVANAVYDLLGRCSRSFAVYVQSLINRGAGD